MQIPVTVIHYLITFKYPAIARYQCYECPGAFHIEWRKAQLIPLSVSTKFHTASSLEELFIMANRATKKFYDEWQHDIDYLFPDHG